MHDVLIIGAGLAGSILAYQLRLADQKVLLISDPSIPSASRIAAGLINPISGQRLVLQENIETLLTSAQSFYRDIEKQFSFNILHQKQMLRVLRSDKEKEHWEKRKKDPDYQTYMDDCVHHDETAACANASAFLQHQTGYLDTNLLLNTLHAEFLNQGILYETSLDYDDLTIKPDGVLWQAHHEQTDQSKKASHQTIQAKTIVFCEGWRGQDNPWFDWLPFQPVKGEILTLSSNSDLPQYIINRGKWLLPFNADTFKLGATYDWSNLNETPTEDAKQELLHAMSQILTHHEPVKVIKHVAGVRPGTKDKHPFLGLHPECPQLGIFNGFGSKGSLLIPWYAEQFVAHLIKKSPLPKQADIKRLHREAHG